MQKRPKEKKKTVGQIAQRLSSDVTNLVAPMEVGLSKQEDYLHNLKWCVHHAMKKVDCYDIKGHDMCKNREAYHGNFFVEVLLKKEGKLSNVLRTFFIPRYSCPSPTNDHSVFMYNAKDDNIEYLWTVPDQETCGSFWESRDRIVPRDRPLMQMISDFKNGILLQRCKKLNGETQKAGILLEVR